MVALGTRRNMQSVYGITHLIWTLVIRIALALQVNMFLL